MKVSFDTLGCKINQFYTNCLKQKNIKEGNEVVSIDENPDTAYINTCAVTARAGSESRKLYRKAKRNAKEVKVFGCQAKLFSHEFEEKYECDEDILIEEEFETSSSRARPYLPIQFGCNNFCAYCIVPYARGKSYSLLENKIIENIEKLIDNDYKEVVLTGIHIGNYSYKNKGLKELLKELLGFDIRIRLTSLMPDYLDPEFIKLFENENLMPHVHLSQQSGSNKILKRMRRKYTRETTLLLSKKLREIRKDIRIAGDFIVGFPGETEKDFDDTENIIKEANFSHLHIFRYSERPYTLANLYPNEVKDSVRKERACRLKKLGKSQRAEFVSENLGKTFKTIIEGNSVLGEKYLTGITPNYIKVHFPENGKKNGIAS
ncbi:MiaB/RimO family radical SAM methylthiotransferase, partial [candidate division WOR-3 bacterium]|nr:MiaB/RimO family radical SAM methylthiotransferase [candidate division WOR-3 bacterium]